MPFDFVLAGRYKLIAPLGEGGMAAVYRARDLRLNREIAIKLLREELTRDPDFLHRFRREAQIVASLSHPNIVPVYDVGEDSGSHFIVMEYVRGRTLKETLSITGPMRSDAASLLLRKILDALQYAHGQGLIHRDVKPHNILLTADGTPRLADFGIAHLADGSTSRTAAILGSAHYLSPEQARGEEATVQSDIYACGIVLFEMLAGHPPFDGPNALAIATQHLHADPPQLPSVVSPVLRNAALRALDKQPNNRFADAAEFEAALAFTDNGDAATQVFSFADRTEVLGPMHENLASPGRSGAHSLLPLDDEDMVLRRSNRKTIAVAAICAFAVAACGYAASIGVAGHYPPQYPSAPYAALPGLLAALLLLSWLNTRSWCYRMDSDAAVVQWGLIGHHRFGMPVRYITTLELKQSPIDRLLRVGTVELCARDQHGREKRLLMEDLPHPSQTYEELMRFLGRAHRMRPSESEE